LTHPELCGTLVLQNQMNEQVPGVDGTPGWFSFFRADAHHFLETRSAAAGRGSIA